MQQSKVAVGVKFFQQLLKGSLEPFDEDFLRERFPGFHEMEGIPINKLAQTLRQQTLPTECIDDYYLWGFLESVHRLTTILGSVEFEYQVNVLFFYCTHCGSGDNRDNHEYLLFKLVLHALQSQKEAENTIRFLDWLIAQGACGEKQTRLFIAMTLLSKKYALNGGTNCKIDLAENPLRIVLFIDEYLYDESDYNGQESWLTLLYDVIPENCKEKALLEQLILF